MKPSLSITENGAAPPRHTAVMEDSGRSKFTGFLSFLLCFVCVLAFNDLSNWSLSSVFLNSSRE